MSRLISIFWSILFLILISSPSNELQAEAVSIVKKTTQHQKVNVKKRRLNRASYQKLKKRFKHRKGTQKKQQTDDFVDTMLIILLAAWYPISIALLIVALVFGITPLLITAIVLLALPVLIFLILGLILIIGLATAGDWC